MRVVVLSLLVACGPADTTEPEEEAPAVEVLLSRYLRGSFNSLEQSRQEPSYFNIELEACRVSLPDLADDVMYVQQQQAGSTPYRQRLYTVEAGEERTARTRVYTVDNESDWVDFCQDGTTEPIAGTGWTERRGCGVEVVFDAERERFTGGTVGVDCATSLGGDYASSEVTINAKRIVSWDRGFFLDGSQAWGATEGGYKFERQDEVPTD